MHTTMSSIPAFPGRLRGFAYVYCPRCTLADVDGDDAFEDWNRWGDAKAAARAHRLACGEGVIAVHSWDGNPTDTVYVPEEGEAPGFAMRYLMAVTPSVRG